MTQSIFNNYSNFIDFFILVPDQKVYLKVFVRLRGNLRERREMEEKERAGKGREREKRKAKQEIE